MPESVYIFDDDPDILLMCSIILKQKGYTVLTSGNCDDIVQKVEEASPAIILMDNKIPPQGGIIATRQLLANEGTRHIPVVYFSANISVEELSKEAGAHYFIQKPFDISELEKLIEKAILNGRVAN